MPRVTNFQHISDLCLMRHKTRLAQNEGSFFYLSAPYEFSYDIEGQTLRFAFPPHKSIHTDFASIPRIFRWLISRTGSHTEAAIVHDFLYLLRKSAVQSAYQNHTGAPPPNVTRAEADAVLWSAMSVARVGLLTKSIMWLAVRVGGWWVYEDRDDNPVLRHGLVVLAGVLGIILTISIGWAWGWIPALLFVLVTFVILEQR